MAANPELSAGRREVDLHDVRESQNFIVFGRVPDPGNEVLLELGKGRAHVLLAGIAIGYLPTCYYDYARNCRAIVIWSRGGREPAIRIEITPLGKG
jgi:hypothetical protein